MKEIFSRNLYFSLCFVALTAAIITYLYFYNREVLMASSFDPSNTDSQDSVEKIVLDISGAVENPGVYTLDLGSRLADLVTLSGGVTNEVSQKWLARSLNLSAVLQDQQKVYVPFEWDVAASAPYYELKELALEAKVSSTESASSEDAAGSTTSSGSGSAGTGSFGSGSDGNNASTGDAGQSSTDTVLIDLNTATRKELITLPGVGEVTADKIIDNRPYIGFEDLKEKAGISDGVIEKIHDLVVF